MRFIYAGDDAELAKLNPEKNRIYVMGLGSVIAYYQDTPGDIPQFRIHNHNAMPGYNLADQMHHLARQIETEFARQMGFQWDRAAFDRLSFEDLVTLTREVTQVNAEIARNRGLTPPETGLSKPPPRRRLSDPAYHRPRNA